MIWSLKLSNRHKLWKNTKIGMEINNKVQAKIKKYLITELGITRQAIEQSINRIKKEYGPMTDEVAYGYLGHSRGKDVSKYIDETSMASVREIFHRIQSTKTPSKPRRPLKTPASKTNSAKARIIQFNDQLTISEPLLPDRILDDARSMTTIYALIYIFENSLRKLVSIIMQSKFGTDWWGKLDKDEDIQKLKSKVSGRQKQEKNNAWHARRGDHPIYYSDLADLLRLIKFYWADFEYLFPSTEWIHTRISEISISRNIVDHHNPLGRDDRTRIELYISDWCRQLMSKFPPKPQGGNHD